MTHVPGVKEVNGKLVATARNIDAPEGWTKDFETMGGEAMWGPGGDIQNFFDDAEIDTTDLKPLFGIDPQTGGWLMIMEVGSPTEFYVYDHIASTLHQIVVPDDLAEIVKCINDRGFGSLEIEKVA